VKKLRRGREGIKMKKEVFKWRLERKSRLLTWLKIVESRSLWDKKPSVVISQKSKRVPLF